MEIHAMARYKWFPNFADGHAGKDDDAHIDDHPGDDSKRGAEQGESEVPTGGSKDATVEQKDGEFRKG